MHGRLIEAPETAYVLGLSGVEYVGSSASQVDWGKSSCIARLRHRRSGAPLPRSRSAGGWHVVALAAAVSTIAISGWK